MSNTANENTAIGAGTLSSNTTGGANTAVGAFGLSLNITGSANTAIGNRALLSNTTGGSNTATGNEQYHRRIQHLRMAHSRSPCSASVRLGNSFRLPFRTSVKLLNIANSIDNIEKALDRIGDWTQKNL